ncbi:MAG: serpin family protein [bacterium]|nr:serpin family protein [bacterium]
MKKSFVFIFSVLLISILTISVFSGEPAEELRRKSYVGGMNKFGFDLFNNILETDGIKNTFISPASISIALSMVINGADKETYEAMHETLQFKNLKLDEINEESRLIIKELQNADKKVELEIANSLWLRKDQSFKKEFLDVNKKYFDATVSVEDFNDKATVKKINDWVKKSTKKKIEKIIDKIESDTIAFLINAIYFKGTWKSEFDKDDTKEEEFLLINYNKKQHPLMFQENKFRYVETENIQAIRLPYGNDRVSMYVFLPAKDSSMKEFLKDLNYNKYQGWIGLMAEHKVKLKLPKFKCEYDKTMNDPLKALGMTIAFNRDKANFGKMCPIPPNVFIQKVQHKTFVEVNEEGTEAAAVTSVHMGIKSAPPMDVYEMYVNRPFFFTIQDDGTGVILFMGVISDPEL